MTEKVGIALFALWVTVFVALAGPRLFPGLVAAQAQQPPGGACEDTLAAFRVLAERQARRLEQLELEASALQVRLRQVLQEAERLRQASAPASGQAEPPKQP